MRHKPTHSCRDLDSLALRTATSARQCCLQQVMHLTVMLLVVSSVQASSAQSSNVGCLFSAAILLSSSRRSAEKATVAQSVSRRPGAIELTMMFGAHALARHSVRCTAPAFDTPEMRGRSGLAVPMLSASRRTVCLQFIQRVHIRLPWFLRTMLLPLDRMPATDVVMRKLPAP